jgi:hypothetical protein
VRYFETEATLPTGRSKGRCTGLDAGHLLDTEIGKANEIWTGPANREAKIALTIGLRLRQA